ncbi:helix-turn-helix domain-containing protein [Paenibacillus alvei]|uniref:helix-turn-helix domain-containing protein n=1 Tax=Paenibacillus alvei TaxID=44250 RepID=UPI0022828F7D|nr:helix-turn-helix domain-containing protein [Paenibacillus alvei]MCY7486725.1 helix-turn-helix domain-containing protein [Paenibacillus alvei]
MRERAERAIDRVMGTEEAAERWELSQDHIKRLCRDGKVIAKRIGKTWVLERDQSNPKQEQ